MKIKHLILSAIVMFNIQLAHAQYSDDDAEEAYINKGDMFIGGALNFSATNENDLDASNTNKQDNFSFYISPSFGYFVTDNFAIGPVLAFGINNTKYSVTNLPSKVDTLDVKTYTNVRKNSDTSFGVGAFGRYYLDVSKRFKLFFNGSVIYSNTNSKLNRSSDNPDVQYGDDDPAETKSKSYSIGGYVTPGISFFISPRYELQAIYGNLYYKYEKEENETVKFDNYRKENNYGLDFNINTFYLGLYYHF